MKLQMYITNLSQVFEINTEQSNMKKYREKKDNNNQGKE